MSIPAPAYRPDDDPEPASGSYPGPSAVPPPASTPASENGTEQPVDPDEAARKEARRQVAIATSMAWTDPANWGPEPEGEWLGKTAPPWGKATRCSARRKGRHCRRAAIAGGTVCRTHGGAAAQVKNKAKLRLLGLVDPAVQVLAREMMQADRSADRQRAANSILDRAGIGRTGSDISPDVARALLIERFEAVQAEARKRELLDDDIEPGLGELEAIVLEDDEPDSAAPSGA